MKIENKVIELLKEKKFHISCAESCTGGLLISTLINVCGASSVIEESYVTYSNDAKVRILGVNPNTIEQYQVESLEVAEEMVLGLYNKTNSEVCISVTGFAGSSEKLPTDGLCFYAIKVLDKLVLESVKVKGDRNKARSLQVKHILKRTLEIIMGGNYEL